MALTFNGSNNTIAGLAVGGLPDDTVALADLSATGTASATTFLRGDNAWAAAGGGKIAQVIKGDMISEGQWSTTSDSYVDITGLTVSITPSAADSKILITSNITSNLVYGSGSSIKNQTKLMRGTADLQEIGDYAAYAVGNGETDSLGVAGFHQYLDTPGAGTHTYKWQIKQTAGGGTTWIQASSSMVAWEILV